MDLAIQIKTARLRYNLTQEAAAATWGFNLKSLRDWEQGRSKPSADNLLKLLPIIEQSKQSPSPPSEES